MPEHNKSLRGKTLSEIVVVWLPSAPRSLDIGKKRAVERDDAMLNPTSRQTMLHQREIDLETLHDQTTDTTTFGVSYPAHIATQPLRIVVRMASPDIISKHDQSLGGKNLSGGSSGLGGLGGKNLSGEKLLPTADVMAYQPSHTVLQHE